MLLIVSMTAASSLRKRVLADIPIVDHNRLLEMPSADRCGDPTARPMVMGYLVDLISAKSRTGDQQPTQVPELFFSRPV